MTTALTAQLAHMGSSGVMVQSKSVSQENAPYAVATVTQNH